MDVQTVIARARSGLGKKTKYESPGVTPNIAAATWPATGAHNDCSGFVSWCLRMPRQLDNPFYKRVNGGWFETSGIYADGLSSVGLFSKLDVPKPGALLVYPDYRGADGRSHDGHIGIVTVVDGTKTGVPAVTSIVHCSLGGWNNHQDAIQETPPAPWLAHSNSIIVWLDGLAG